MPVLQNIGQTTKAPASQYVLSTASSSPTRRPPPGVVAESMTAKDQCLKIISHEFRALQLDPLLAKMSVFDLIDHCAALFEELTQHLASERGFCSYVRSFLIFNYFVNTFIMVHFNGFAKFMENLHQDFIIYLNLYNFFRRDDILGPNAFDVDLAELRQWIIQYLTSKDLLSFDVDLLFGWLNEYIDYLKHKDDDSSDADLVETNLKSHSDYYKTDGSKLYSLSLHLKGPNNSLDGSLEDDDDMFNFNSRFPDVSPSLSPSKDPPYPVEDPGTTKKEMPPYPLNSAVETSKRPLAIPPAVVVPRVSPINASGNGTGPRNPGQVSYNSSQSFVSVSSSLQLTAREPPLPPPHQVPSSSLLTYSAPYGNNFQADGQLDPHTRHPIYANRSDGHGVALAAQNNGHGNGQGPYLQRPAPNVNGNPYANYYRQLALLPYGQYTNGQPMINGQPVINVQPISNGQPVINNQPPMLAQPVVNGHMIPSGHVPFTGSVQNLKSSWMRDHCVCGLKNMGSSCYINSVTQVFFGLGRINYLFDANSELSQRLRSLHKKPKLVDSVANLLSTFNGNGGANIAPTKFLRVLSSLKPDFNIPFEQQDAQEFLLFMIDRLHEELAKKPVGDFVDYISKWKITVNPKERDEYLKWYHQLLQHEGESPINDLCQGHVQSKLSCNTCGHKSISYSPFSILSLPIPNANSRGVDLTDCLRYYTQDEVLSGENAWRCPKCNKDSDSNEDKENPMDVVFQPKRGMFKFSKRSKSPAKKTSSSSAKSSVNSPAPTAISIKQLSFIKLPPVLFIHLSRFSMFNLTDKLHTDITYPLRLKFNHQTHDIVYNLTGLINHYGNLKSGHYTSLVNKASVHGKGPVDPLQSPAWCYFDDDHIRINVPHGDVNSNDSNKLRSRDVYVLCYERI